MADSVKGATHPAGGDAVERAFISFMLMASAAPKYADHQFYLSRTLSMTKYVALSSIAAEGGNMRPSDLATCTGTGLNSVCTLVARMKREDLVTTCPRQDDKRGFEVHITANGRTVLERASVVARSIMNEFMRGVSDRDAARTEKVLRTMGANIKQKAYEWFGARAARWMASERAGIASWLSTGSLS
jgi:DNA-binding MarR family transcriptional regulator